MKEIDSQVTEPETDNRDEKELEVFDRDIGIRALKSPYPVPEIVIRGAEDEPKGVGDVFVPLELLLAKPRNAEIDHRAGKTDYAVLHKLSYQHSVNHGFQI